MALCQEHLLPVVHILTLPSLISANTQSEGRPRSSSEQGFRGLNSCNRSRFGVAHSPQDARQFLRYWFLLLCPSHWHGQDPRRDLHFPSQPFPTSKHTPGTAPWAACLSRKERVKVNFHRNSHKTKKSRDIQIALLKKGGSWDSGIAAQNKTGFNVWLKRKSEFPAPSRLLPWIKLENEISENPRWDGT